MNPIAAVVAGGLLLGLPMAASAAVSVIGNGPAKACWEAAKQGASEARHEELCTTALETQLMSPRDRAGTYVNRGVIKLRRGLYEEAIGDFDTAIRLKPDLSEAYANRGAAGIGARRFPQSVADLTSAIDLGVPEVHKSYYNRAVAYEWLDDPKAAYADYLKARELAPEWELVRQRLERFEGGSAAGQPERASFLP